MILYHYTDQNGFMGILGNTELWATKIQYLNDSNEFFLALTIAHKLLSQKMENILDPNVKLRLERFRANLSNIDEMNICICSLSEEGDLLSQWRGYSRLHSGYSVGFDSRVLKRLLTPYGYTLKKCIYDQKEQTDLIDKAINDALLKFRNYIEPKKHWLEYDSESSEFFIDMMIRIAPLIKDPSFAEEKEWRIISEEGIEYEFFSFRAGPSMLVPFHKISLRKDYWKLIRSITIGHTPHPQLALSATKAYMAHLEAKARRIPEFAESEIRIPIKNSTIPYRSW